MYISNFYAFNQLRAKAFTQAEAEAAKLAMHRALAKFYLHAPCSEMDICTHQIAHIAEALPMHLTGMWAYERLQRHNR